MIFQILIDENLVYSSDVQQGNAIGLNPKLKQKLNNEDDLSFTKLEDIDIDKKSVVRVLRDGVEISRGRPKSSSMSFNKLTTIKCEGQLAFLGDSVQPQKKYTDTSIPDILKSIINIHNQQVEEYKQFQLGNCEVNTFINFETNYQSTMEVIKTLASERSGYILFRKPTSGNKYFLDFLSYNSGALATQKVRFGENLLDFNRNKSISNIYSVIVPLGATLDQESNDGQEQRLTIESVNGGNDALQNDTLVATYGKIAKVKTYDNITSPSTLKSRALSDLNNQLTNLTLDVKFVDQHWIDSSIPAFSIGDQVQVISEPHDLDKAFILSEMTLEFDHPERSTITLGRSNNTKLSTAVSQVSGTAVQALDSTISRNAIAWQAQQMANKMFNTDGTGSFIQFDLNDDGVVEQIIAMDSPDASLAKKKLVINKNGVGGSSNGGQTFETALTTDCWIYGNRIIAGSINAEQLSVQYKTSLQTTIDDAASGAITSATTSANNYTDGKLTGYYDKSTVDTKFEVVNGSISSQITQVNSSVSTVKSDLQGQIASVNSSLKNEISGVSDSINATAGQLGDRINGVATDAANALATVETTLQSKIDQNAESIKASVSKVESKIDGIQIGTRNLLLNSHFERNGAEWGKGGSNDVVAFDTDSTYGKYLQYTRIDSGGTYQQRPSGDGTLKLNTEYAFSFMAKAPTAMQIRICGVTFDITTNWKRYTGTKTWDSGVPTFIIYPVDTSSRLDITMIKLEEGTIPSQWTPAPEDMEQLVTTAKAEFEIATDSISSKVTSLTETLDKSVEELESKIQQTADSIDLSVMKISNPNVNLLLNTDFTMDKPNLSVPNGRLYWSTFADTTYSFSGIDPTYGRYFTVTANSLTAYNEKAILRQNLSDRGLENVVGQQRTYSFVAKVLSGGTSAIITSINSVQIKITTEWQRYSMTMTPVSSWSKTNLQNFTLWLRTTGVEVAIAQIKYEEGPVATAWNTSTEGLATQAALKITDSSISTKVDKGSIISAINQSAESVSISASKLSLGNLATKAELTLTNNQISTKVSKGNVISAINQSAESISIEASKLSLEGVTTINNNFIIYGDGTMSCDDALITNTSIKNGTIGGMYLKDNYIRVNSVPVNYTDSFWLKYFTPDWYVGDTCTYMGNKGFSTTYRRADYISSPGVVCNTFSYDRIETFDKYGDRVWCLYFGDSTIGFWYRTTSYANPISLSTYRVSTEVDLRALKNFECYGTKSRIAKTKDYGERLLYCYETPTPMFGDIGEGIISEDGLCYVYIDPKFYETINSSQYQVFLQKYGQGDCWVETRNPNYFIVKGTPGLAFGWEMKAKQLGYEQLRLDRNTSYFERIDHHFEGEAALHLEKLKEMRYGNGK